jgi:polyisoprenoid-binding protein YceI
MPGSTVTEMRSFVAGTWEIDSVCSEVSFDIRHFTVRRAHGRLNRLTGTIVTEQDYGHSSVRATIDAASISTGGPKSDGHVRSGRFLDVENFRTITFQSTDVFLADRSFYVQGDLTIRGTTRSVMLDVKMLGFTPDLDGMRMRCSTTTQLSRMDFGVRPTGLLEVMDNTLVIGDAVNVTLNIEAAPRSGHAGSSSKSH